MGETIEVLLFNGESLTLPEGKSLNDIYNLVYSKVDRRSFGVFDLVGKYLLREETLTPKGRLFVYRGELAEINFYIKDKLYNHYPIKIFSREFGYVYHNQLLNKAALERLVLRAFPEKLFESKNLTIDSITVTDNTINVRLASMINPETAYRMIGALRLINISPNITTKYIRGLGMFKVASSPYPQNGKLTSQILSTWGRKEEFSELDKEIRNYRHYLMMVKEIPQKKLEGFFIDNANEVQETGLLPDPFTDIGKVSSYIDSQQHTRIIELLKQKPALIKGSLNMYPTYFTWKSLSSEESYKFPMSTRVKVLAEREEINDGDIAKMVVRYASMGAAGQFTMTPRSVVQFIAKTFDIKYEGFGAPFNVDLPFCSLMYDVDIPFGSMGPFSWKQLLRRSGNWSINPPFTEKLLELTVSNVLMACDHLPIRDETQFHVLFPGWEDNPWMDILTGKEYSQYLVETIHMKLGEFSFERIDGTPLYKPFGGLVYTVFSPAGKSHSTFGKREILQIKEKFGETVPAAVKKNLENEEHIGWKELLAKRAAVET